MQLSQIIGDKLIDSEDFMFISKPITRVDKFDGDFKSLLTMFDSDGVIFTNVHRSLEFGGNSEILKFKFRHTVDVGFDHDSLWFFDRNEGWKQDPAIPLQLGRSLLKFVDKDIIECEIQVQEDPKLTLVCTPIRIRTDKKTPNSAVVILDIVKALLDNVSIEEITGSNIDAKF